MKIVISGFYGLGNTGDEAILDSMIDNLRNELDNPDITVFSLSPEETARKHNVKSVFRGWKHENLKKIRSLQKADLLLSGGGGLLQDITPTRVVSGALPYYLLIVLMAKLTNTKVMYFSQGIGTVTTAYGKILMKTLGNLADFATVRDAYSKDYLRKLGTTKFETVVTSDIVFAYQEKEDNAACDSLGLEGNDNIVGVSVRPWLGQTKYQKEMAKLLDKLVVEKGITPVFIPMEGKHDEEVSENIRKYMKYGNQTYMLETNFTPNQYLQFIKKCDMVIGMRLHSLIFAVLCEVPFVSVSYDRKVESLAKRVEMWDYGCRLDDFNADDGYEMCVELTDSTNDVKQTLSYKRKMLRKQAMKNIELMKDRFVE